MSLDQKGYAQKVHQLQIERAKFMVEKAADLSPFGHRSASLQYFDAKLYLATIADIQARGLKSTADEREAIFEGVKQTNVERGVKLQAQLKANEGLANLDADIEYNQRMFTAVSTNEISQ